MAESNLSPPKSSAPPNPWNYKPWWCQPWSIVLTGLTVILGSWVFLKIWWLTLLIALPILAWMTFFLLIWPGLIIQSGILTSEPIPPKN